MNAKTLLLSCAFAAAGTIGAAPPAAAGVVYAFAPDAVTVLRPDLVPTGYETLRPGVGARFSFEVSEAAVERGSFAVRGAAGGGPASWTGDVDDFVRFVGPEASVTPTSLRGGYASVDLSLTFDGAGNVLTGSLAHVSWNERLTFAFADNGVTGRWDSEFPSCWHGCEETGTLTIQGAPTAGGTAVAALDVPEPASLAVTGFALAGLLVARRRRA